MARAPRPPEPLTPEQSARALAGLPAALRSVGRRGHAVAAVIGADFDDVRQEAALAACLAARSFPGHGDFEKYAATAARSQLRILCRSAGQRCRDARLVLLSSLDFEEHPTEDRRRGGGAGALVRRALRLARRLPDRQRQALTLMLTGETYRSAGRAMGLDANTVKHHAFRAAAAVRAMLEAA